MSDGCSDGCSVKELLPPFPSLIRWTYAPCPMPIRCHTTSGYCSGDSLAKSSIHVSTAILEACIGLISPAKIYFGLRGKSTGTADARVRPVSSSKTQNTLRHGLVDLIGERTSVWSPFGSEGTQQVSPASIARNKLTRISSPSLICHVVPCAAPGLAQTGVTLYGARFPACHENDHFAHK